MYKAKVRLVYKQVIDETSQSGFEKAIFHASYQEFLLKSQAYNPDGKLKTFSSIKAGDGHANSLHYKLSFATGHFMAGLNNEIPGLKDNLGSNIKFDVPKFELIESDVTDRSAHKIAINYITETITLVNQLAEFMVLANGDATEQDSVDTYILKMQPNLSIISYQECRQAALIDEIYQEAY